MTGRMLAGRSVCPIGIGTARLSIADPIDEKEAISLLDLAIDLGLAYVDTAMAYTTAERPSHAESLVAHVLAHRPGEVLVGTKGGHYRSGSEWLNDARPSVLRRHCEASLRALAVDTIDLYYLHFPDPAVPLEDSVGALDELRVEGKVRTIGLSNVSLAQLDSAAAVAPITAVQNPFSPYRSQERDVLSACESRGVAFVASSPLGGTRRPVPLEWLSHAATAAGQQLGVGIGTVWLAWMLRVSASIIPVTGARRRESLEASWRATELRLSDEQFAAIEYDLRTAHDEKG